MSDLSNQQQNQSFVGILQVPGGITSTLKQVQDGDGNNTGLWLSSTNTNIMPYDAEEQVITATAGQTVFNLSISYTPATDSLQVFVNGLNKIVGIDYLETDTDTVTFLSGQSAGALVKFTTAAMVSNNAVDASNVAFVGVGGEHVNVQDLADPVGSDYIGFVQSGTGAVTRSVQDKARETVSIKDFGAHSIDEPGYETFDSTAAIQAALNASFHVLVPIGSYLISSAITVPARTLLEFQGGLGNTTGVYPPARLIKKSTMTTAGLYIASTGRVIGGGIFCQPGNTGDGVVLNGNSAKISHFLVHGAGNDGIRVGADGVTSNFNSCEITHCTSQYNGRHGLYIHDGKVDTSTGANANACTVTQFFSQHNGSDGIRLGFCWWITLVNCLTEVNAGYGLYLSGANASTYPQCRWATVVGGDYNEGNTAGAIFDQSYFSVFFGLDQNATPTTSGSGLQGSAWRTSVYGNNVETAKIKFPATQITSSDPNTLDDYEEGTWTPAQSGASLTVTSATYTKIGRLVHFTFDITWPVTADTTGISITGFVHTPQVNSGTFAPGYTTYTTNRFAGVTGPAGLALYQNGSTQLTNANLSGARVIGSGIYYAAT